MSAGWITRALRSGVYLVLGGILASGYLILIVGVIQLVQAAPAVPLGLSIVVAVLAVPVALIPPLLNPIREVEIAAVRSLLGADIPAAVAAPGWDGRLRSAGYFTAHLVLGGAAVAALLFGIPAAVGLVGLALGADGVGLQVTPPDLGLWGIGVAILIVAALPVLAAAGGAMLCALAPPLLGPSATEREIAERHQRLRLAERNRIARELHDSVGHALSITTMQASAAEAALGSDEAAVRAALAEIATAGRTATADLDRSLAVLREDGQAGTRDRPPVLADVLGAQWPGGRELILNGDRAHLDLPDASLSREAYHLISEAAMNAWRHGTGTPKVAWHRVADRLEVEVSNATAVPAQRDSPGRGLIGMRERAALIGAELAIRPGDGEWVVTVRFPAEQP